MALKQVSLSLSLSAVLCSVLVAERSRKALFELAVQATPSLLIHSHTHLHLWNGTVLARTPTDSLITTILFLSSVGRRRT